MIFIDTNMLIRVITGDMPDMAMEAINTIYQELGMNFVYLTQS